MRPDDQASPCHQRWDHPVVPGSERLVQSMAFFRAAENEPLYSGLATISTVRSR